MDEDAYNRFATLDRLGRREESKIAVRQFLDSFENREERDLWARSFLHTLNCFDKNGRFRARVRQELFDEVLSQYLADGVHHEEPMCSYWLAALYENSACNELTRDLTSHGSVSLLSSALSKEPNCEPIQRALKSQIVKFLDDAFHSWPLVAGSNDLNNVQRYDDLIDQAYKLDSQREFKDSLDDLAEKNRLYRLRLL